MANDKVDDDTPIPYYDHKNFSHIKACQSCTYRGK